ncbi:MAG: hypothetical protein HZC26_01935 [Candidatus Magasanikbacteria bacterium]|nr:hypothetical protein [Candidatus Magasanikbacteria bacterium]
MKKKKQNAIRLRKRGWSYNEINRSLKIAKSTLSFWLKEVKISQKAKIRIRERVNKTSIAALVHRNKLQTEYARIRALKIRRSSSKTIGRLTNRDLLLIGSALYWGEGYKKGAEGSVWKCVDFTNSDPKMVAIMMRFFREVCEVKTENFKIQLMLHCGLLAQEAVNFWSKMTKIPTKQFLKVSIINSKKKKKKSKTLLKYGTIHIRVYNVDLFHKIIGLVDGLKINTGA